MSKRDKSSSSEMFDFELDRVSSWIRENGFTTAALQLPEGLKVRATEISDFLNKQGVRTVVLGNPCYGACDIYEDFHDVADCLIHFGHSEIPSQNISDDVLYIESFYDGDVSEKVSAIVDRLPQKVGLLATVQYVKNLDQAKTVIDKSGRTAIIGKGDARVKYPGQVLGCNCSSAEKVDVDCFLFLGEGDFHPLAAAFGVGKEIKVLNPITGELRSVDDVRDRILRKRFAMIQSAMKAESFLVIVCTKVGQMREKVAEEVCNKLEAKGKMCYTVYLNEITPVGLMPYNVDCIVSTACPRIAMDDSSRYGKPIITPTELDVVLGITDWEHYKFDTIVP